MKSYTPKSRLLVFLVISLLSLFYTTIAFGTENVMPVATIQVAPIPVANFSAQSEPPLIYEYQLESFTCLGRVKIGNSWYVKIRQFGQSRSRTIKLNGREVTEDGMLTEDLTKLMIDPNPNAQYPQFYIAGKMYYYNTMHNGPTPPSMISLFAEAACRYTTRVIRFSQIL